MMGKYLEGMILATALGLVAIGLHIAPLLTVVGVIGLAAFAYANRPTPTSAVEEVKRDYAAGEIDELELEQRLESVLQNERDG